MKHPARVRKIARERFGFDNLRSGQEEAIVSVLEGHDTLAVMPPGAGKSVIYQIPALMMPGPTVVISPIPFEAATPASDALWRDLEFLFFAPEQLQQQETLDGLQAARPSLLVFDEAHYIDDWGPEVLRLRSVLKTTGCPTVIALTAKADLAMRVQIVERLGMRNPRIVVRGFDRANIWLGACVFADDHAKCEALLAAVEATEKPGIVYVSTEREAEEIAVQLNDRGVRALFYHDGMPASRRDPVRSDFMSGQCDAIVATAAFEPSVDKPDIRFVFHYGLSGSFETYYRAMGHAGRDGKQARALLFYDVQTDPFESGRLVPDTMREYAEFTGCRREFLLRHFGEAAPGGCENCDRCQSGKLGKAQYVRTQAG